MAWPKGATRGPDGKPVVKANGAGSDSEITLDPAELAGSAASGSPADSGAGNGSAARGSKAARSDKAPKKVAKVNVDGLSKILLAIHTTLAVKTQDPLWLLDEKEAKMMADAASEVAKHYDMGLADKYIAWGHLAYAAGAVYGTRAVASMARSQRQDQPANPTPPSAFARLNELGASHAAH